MNTPVTLRPIPYSSNPNTILNKPTNNTSCSLTQNTMPIIQDENTYWDYISNFKRKSKSNEMNNWESWLSIGGFAIALYTLVFTVRKYRKYEKRLNEQKVAINNYQLKKIQEEESAALKAVIKGNIVSHTKGSDQLRVFNTGQANATNIRIEIIGSRDGLMVENFENIEVLNPQRVYDFVIPLASRHINMVQIKYTWDDASGKNREKTEYLQVV